MRGAIAPLLVVTAVVACATVPYTHRSQIVLVSPAEEAALGAQAFGEVTKERQVVRGTRDAALVDEVGRRLAAVSGKPGYAWEFVLLQGKEVNAFALPGGKAAVFTGLLPVARDTNGLAVVMGHEIAHVIARHGAERMSQTELLQLGGVALGAAAGQNAQAVMAAYGLGAQLGVLLPFGRSQESEADRIGLILMARAGYDPRGALAFWQRMESQSASAAPPQWLSTHPSYGTRRSIIADTMAEALQYYEVANRASVRSLE